MPRIRQTGVRLSESLIAKLKREASRHHVSFNREVQMRLEDSFENRDAPRALDTIQEQMRWVWERYSNRLLMLDLEEAFVRRVLQSTDIEVVADANMWLMRNAREHELERKWKELPNLKRSEPSRLLYTQEDVEATMRAAKPRSFKKGEISRSFEKGRPGRPGQPKWKPHWEGEGAARPRPSSKPSPAFTEEEFDALTRAAKSRTFKKRESKKGETS